MGEGASVDKLLFGVSGIATWSFETLGHMNAEFPNAEMNARSHGANPMVQVILGTIGGILFLLTV
jgi:hypothetical protein